MDRTLLGRTAAGISTLLIATALPLALAAPAQAAENTTPRDLLDLPVVGSLTDTLTDVVGDGVG